MTKRQADIERRLAALEKRVGFLEWQAGLFANAIRKPLPIRLAKSLLRVVTHR